MCIQHPKCYAHPSSSSSSSSSSSDFFPQLFFFLFSSFQIYLHLLFVPSTKNARRIHSQSRSPQQQQQQQQQFSLQSVDNHIFEPQQDSQPLFFNQYVSDNNQMSLRRDSIQHRSRQPTNSQRQQQQQQYQAPPLLQIPSEDHYHQQQQQTIAPPRFKQQQHPAYVACLNHGINYNGVSGPPILLPPSF
jgi:hypothetical protein